ncbi:MAG: porin family protein [Prevotella multiformis]|uniref:porin family protein n=1 Tax=Prevotella multiformis TaxID=282402 RepID=UPI003FA0B366
MKKVLFVAAMMFSSVATFAQHAVGSINLQPKVGVSIANLTDNNSSDARVGLVAGVEGEYQASDIFSVSAGLLYSMQGAKAEALGIKSTEKLDYINVPIMANVYVVKGLAVKLGVQPGFKVNDKLDVKIPGFGNNVADLKAKAKSVDFSIPVGISYEYNNFQVDARYNWGLTKVFDVDNFKLNQKNSVFQITLGYKFDL